MYLLLSDMENNDVTGWLPWFGLLAGVLIIGSLIVAAIRRR